MVAASWQKEQISTTFVHAIATQAGCTVARWNADIDGVDASVKRGAPQVDLQLKCTQNLRPSGDGYAFDLDVATYDKLRDMDRSAPGYLVVVVVPAELEQWLCHNEEDLLLRCRGFYACIQDRPESTNAATVAIHLPATHRFDTAALDAMLDHARRRVRRALNETQPA